MVQRAFYGSLLKSSGEHMQVGDQEMEGRELPGEKISQA